MITIEIKEHNRLAEEFSAFVSFKYDKQIVETLRSLPFKFYDPKTTQWEIPLKKVKYVCDNLAGMDIKIIGDKSRLEETKFEVPEKFKFKTEPFNHQLECFEFGLTNDCWFLGDEQGLGKTKQSIDIAVARKLIYGYKHCLIVCGVNTLKWNWVNEVHTHSDEEAYILGQRIKKGKVRIGSTKDKLDDLAILKKDQPTPYFIITNVESFRDEKIANTISELCKKGIINMCVADEMHKMKNPTSQQTKGFLKCQPECRIGMTGTPLMNSPLDLYVVLKWLGYEQHAFYNFKNHYCVMGGYGGYEVVGYRNLNQLTSKLNDIMLRRRKSSVLDLPEKIYVDEYIEMSAKQSVLYTEIENGLKADIDLIANNPNPLSALIRLRQCTGYTGILSSTIQESAKLDRMVDIVDECVSNDEKVIIFSNWTQMTDIICEKLNQDSLCITGDTKDEDRQTYVSAFQNDPDFNVIVGTIGAMGTGLTLTAATTIIFVDEPWNKALFEQAVDRAHRIGTTSNVTIYSLMCKDTIDERIHSIIYNKGVMSDAIVDGKVLGNKSEVLNYLLG